MTWLPYSLAATLFLGISTSLYKLPSFKGYSSFFSTFWTNTFATVIVVVVMMISNTMGALLYVSWYGILWGVLFATTMVLQKILLQRAETNTVFPVTSSLGSIATIVLGVALLSEHVSLVQIFGMVTILGSVYMYTRKDGPLPLDKRTVLLGLGIIAASTASKFVQKMGAVQDHLGSFLVYQYIGAALFALLVAYYFEGANFSQITNLKKYWKGSAAIALFTVLGGYAIVYALKTGPLSAVYAIHPAYTVVAGFLGYLMFKEKLTAQKVLLAIISILGVILIKIGG
jgi:drug/metabolite transporter (DMT)-like permease